MVDNQQRRVNTEGLNGPGMSTGIGAKQSDTEQPHRGAGDLPLVVPGFFQQVDECVVLRDYWRGRGTRMRSELTSLSSHLSRLLQTAVCALRGTPPKHAVCVVDVASERGDKGADVTCWVLDDGPLDGQGE